MKENKLTLVVIVKAKDGFKDFIFDELKKLLEPTRSEVGNISYNIHLSDTDPNTFVFYEKWRSKADLEQHLKTPALTRYAEVTKDATAEWTIMELHQLDI